MRGWGQGTRLVVGRLVGGRMTAACVTGSLFASLIFKLKNAPGDAVSVGGWIQTGT